MNFKINLLIMFLVFASCSKPAEEVPAESVKFELSMEPLTFNSMKVILEVTGGQEQFKTLKDFGVVYSEAAPPTTEEILLTNPIREKEYRYTYILENLDSEATYYFRPFAEYASGVTYTQTKEFRQPEYTYIPDINLENRLIQLGYDNLVDQHILKETAATIDSLYLTDYGVKDLTGIQDFSGLYYLHLSEGQLTELDLSANTELTKLIIPGNNLGYLDLSNNLKLKYLFIANINISSIDLSKNPNLEELIIGFNSLSSIDLSKNTQLKRLDIGANHLTQLDLSSHIYLKRVSVVFNQLQSLSLPQSNTLEEAEIGSRYIEASNAEELNRIQNLDLSSYTNLKLLRINNLGLENLDLTNNVFLDYLEAEGNNFGCVSVSANLNNTFPETWYLDPNVSICNP